MLIIAVLLAKSAKVTPQTLCKIMISLKKKRIIIEDKNLLSQIKMVEEIITFGEIEKYKFYSYF